jgi:hypothetical protein
MDELNRIEKEVAMNSPVSKMMSLCIAGALPCVATVACMPTASHVNTFVSSEVGQGAFDMSAAVDSEILALEQEFSNEESMVLASAASQSVEDEALSVGSFALSGSGVKWSPAQVVANIQSAWNRAGKSACGVLKPFLKAGGTSMNHPYFFVGANAQAGVGVQMVWGRDFVWDLYNLQFASFTHKGPEIVLGSGMAGAGGGTYAGLGFGVRPDVNAAWSGVFVSTGIGGSLPILADILSGNVTAFAAGTSAGKPDLSFVGGSVGISASVSAPTASPFNLQNAQGFWKLDTKVTSQILKRWQLAKIPVSMSGADTCGGTCVRFDQAAKKASYRGRAMNLAASMGTFVSPVLKAPFPGLEKVMLLAIATGAFRDALNHGQTCAR